MIVQFPSLGSNGGFGNQIFQYFFLIAAKRRFGAEIRTPIWIGERYFDISPTIQLEHSAFSHNFYDPERNRSLNADIETLGTFLSEHHVVDVTGFFQYHTSHMNSNREMFNQVYGFNSNFEYRIACSGLKTTFDNEFVLAVHIRQADYLNYRNHPFIFAPDVDDYVSSIIRILDSSPRGVRIYLCSDELALVGYKFTQARIPFITRLDFLANIPSVDDCDATLVDFYAMSRASALVISNSSFSMSAAMLNGRSTIFLRPSIHDHQFVPFSPWNSPVLLSRTGRYEF